MIEKIFSVTNTTVKIERSYKSFRINRWISPPTIVAMTEKIFSAMKTIVAMTEKIFSGMLTIVWMIEKIFSGTLTIVAVMEKIFSLTKTIVAATEKIFSIANTMVWVAQKILSEFETMVSVMKKTSPFHRPMDSLIGISILRGRSIAGMLAREIREIRSRLLRKTGLAGISFYECITATFVLAL